MLAFSLQPKKIDWEATLACNMQCKHCASTAGFAREKELTSDEAMGLCEQLDVFAQAQLTLTGGEFFLRRDWQVLTEELIKKRGAITIQSNAWLLDADMVQQLKDIAAGRGTIKLEISLDGDRSTHDDMRCKGSFERVIAALAALRTQHIDTALITAVSPQSMDVLDDIYKLAARFSVSSWRLRVTNEFGRAADDGRLIFRREHVAQLANKIAQYRQQSGERGCKVLAGDCIGYFGKSESHLRDVPWQGCRAGLERLGIQSNGNVKGCLSLAEDEFVEGNVLHQSLAQIWQQRGAFAYNRAFEPSQLTGPCTNCNHGSSCRAGCHAVAFAMLGTVHESPYCLYAQEQGYFDDREPGVVDAHDMTAQTTTTTASHLSV